MRICHRLNGVKRKAIYAPLCVPAGTRTAAGKNKIGSPPANPLESLRQLLSWWRIVAGISSSDEFSR
jgi:hypothetical protein